MDNFDEIISQWATKAPPTEASGLVDRYVCKPYETVLHKVIRNKNGEVTGLKSNAKMAGVQVETLIKTQHGIFSSVIDCANFYDMKKATVVKNARNKLDGFEYIKGELYGNEEE